MTRCHVIQDWAIIRRDTGEVLIAFTARALAHAHYRKLDHSPALRVVRREITTRLVSEYVRPARAPEPDPLAIPEIVGAMAV